LIRLEMNPIGTRQTMVDRISTRCNVTATRLRQSHQKSNYELFNCSNFNIRYWSWNYRGCWPLNTDLNICKYLYKQHRSSHTLCYSTYYASTLAGGLVRSLSLINSESDPHLTARYDGQTLL
jgi:hypothetical protein